MQKLMIWLKRKIKVLVINPPPRIHKKDIKNLLQILQIYYGYEEKMWRSVFNVPLGLTFWHWKSLSIHFHHQLWVLLRQLLSSLPLNQSCFGPIRTCTRLSSYIFTSAMMHSFLVLNLQAKPGKGYIYIYVFKYSSVIDLKWNHMTKSYHLIQSDLQISVKYLITVNASTWITCTKRINPIPTS